PANANSAICWAILPWLNASNAAANAATPRTSAAQNRPSSLHLRRRRSHVTIAAGPQSAVNFTAIARALRPPANSDFLDRALDMSTSAPSWSAVARESQRIAKLVVAPAVLDRTAATRTAAMGRGAPRRLAAR